MGVFDYLSVAAEGRVVIVGGVLGARLEQAVRVTRLYEKLKSYSVFDPDCIFYFSLLDGQI